MCGMCTDGDFFGILFWIDCGCPCENITGEFRYCKVCQHYTGFVVKEVEGF